VWLRFYRSSSPTASSHCRYFWSRSTFHLVRFLIWKNDQHRPSYQLFSPPYAKRVHPRRSGVWKVERRCPSLRDAEPLTEKPGPPGSVQWETGFKARFPWLVFGAIALMLVDIAMMGVVLGTSSDKSREEWPGQHKIRSLRFERSANHLTRTNISTG
jgi:hypothetical protein